MKRNIIYVLVAFLILPACYPGGPEYYEETDLVYSNYDDQFDFTATNSYSMPDRIVKITGELLEGELPEFIEDKYGNQILNAIENNMSDLGWTRTDQPGDADLVLMPAMWSNTTIYYWYDYWCWYYPWYCGWGYYYPGYFTSYTTGTLVMLLVAAGDDYIEPAHVWTGAVNGILSGAFDISRVNRGIDRAFEQSPYLDIN